MQEEPNPVLQNRARRDLTTLRSLMSLSVPSVPSCRNTHELPVPKGHIVLRDDAKPGG